VNLQATDDAGNIISVCTLQVFFLTTIFFKYCHLAIALIKHIHFLEGKEYFHIYCLCRHLYFLCLTQWCLPMFQWKFINYQLF